MMSLLANPGLSLIIQVGGRLKNLGSDKFFVAAGVGWGEGWMGNNKNCSQHKITPLSSCHCN